MIKKITKIGNSQGIIFDNTIMELARLKPGDEVNLEIHDGGAMTITPLKPTPKAADVSNAIQDVMNRYSKTMQRLA
jgi:antitoxin component of MazEF toxin-antitoxin module